MYLILIGTQDPSKSLRTRQPVQNVMATSSQLHYASNKTASSLALKFNPQLSINTILKKTCPPIQ